MNTYYEQKSVTLTHADWLTMLLALWDAIALDKERDMTEEARTRREAERMRIRDMIRYQLDNTEEN